MQVYVDHSDDDFIGFKRDAYGRIQVVTESDDPNGTDDGYYEDGPYYQRNSAFGP